jgi:hypothetical protein
MKKDALETLGQLIEEDETRDAVHIAVIPAVADQVLYPSQRVAYDSGLARVEGKHVGIVDPFLDLPRLHPDDRFWLFLFPRSITGLRHIWTHPDIPEKVLERAIRTTNASEEIIRQHYCNEFDYDTVMEAAEDFAKTGGFHYIGMELAYATDFDTTFWTAFTDITGIPKPAGDECTSYFFRCAC